MRKFLFIVLLATLSIFGCYGQTASRTSTSLRTIDKAAYVERYRTIYLGENAAPRTAQSLPAPIHLLGRLWVYPEDMGTYRMHPDGVIESLNAQNPYGRNNWRIPTPDELALLEANADQVGLGDAIYMATDHANGVLRLVSTGRTTAEQEYATAGVPIGGLRWATTNLNGKGSFAPSPLEIGDYFTAQDAANACPDGWRTPMASEMLILQRNDAGWKVVNGVSGRVYGNGPDAIFLPVTGFVNRRGESDSDAQNRYTEGAYWTSTHDAAFPQAGNYLSVVREGSLVTYAEGSPENRSLRAIRCVKK